MDSLTKVNVPPTQTLSLIDDRLSIDKTVYSDCGATPEKPKRPLKRPLLDDDDLLLRGHIPNPFQRNRRMLNVYVNRTPPSFNSYETRFICYERIKVVCYMTPWATRTTSARTYSSYHFKRHGPPELFYGLPKRKSDNSPGPLQVTDLNVTAPTITTSSLMNNNQRNVLTNSQSSQPWQTSGVTLFVYPSNLKRRVLKQVFTFRTMNTFHGMVTLTRYEQKLPRISLSDLHIKDVIRLLRDVAETTSNNATYNFRDTFQNNLLKITVSFVPDNMEEA